LGWYNGKHANAGQHRFQTEIIHLFDDHVIGILYDGNTPGCEGDPHNNACTFNTNP
jgi:hypothetical protein